MSEIIANHFGTIIMNEDNQNVIYGAIPGAVITQYYDKDKKAIGVAQKHEFLTLAAYLLWVIDIASTLTPLSASYSDFAYFAATRPIDSTLLLENQYVIRSYTLVK